MAVYNWLGRALARAQVDTITIALTWAANDTATVTINGKSCTYTATGASTTTIATGLYTLLAAMTDPEFTAITWANPSNGVITATSATAGVPFILTATETTAGNGTCSSTTTTAATGPNHWNDPVNWDQGANPGNGDTANVNLSLNSVSYGLDQSAVTLASLFVYSTSVTQNTLGLPQSNAAGYTEYLEQSLKIGATASVIDADSPLVKINFGSVANAMEVRRTGTSSNPPIPAVLIKGTNAANTIDVVNGNVGLAYYEGEAYNASSCTGGPGAFVTAGTGAVIADTVSVNQILFQGTGTNFQTDGGTAEIRGTPGFSTLVCSGGNTIAKFGGTVADVVVGPGTIDASQDLTPRTFTNCSLDIGGQINDPNETIEYTNGITLEQGVSSLQAA